MTTRLYDLIFIAWIILLMVFIIVNSLEYQEFQGISGSGSYFGISFSWQSVIVFVLLLVSIPVYIIKRKVKR
jgi:uncharacterized membrane protein